MNSYPMISTCILATVEMGVFLHGEQGDSVAALRLTQNSFKPPSRSSADLKTVEKEVENAVKHLLALKKSKAREMCKLTQKTIEKVVSEARQVFLSQPMLLEPKAPITICGDTHGQYYDLLKILEIGGMLPENNFLFLGDYVDRADMGIETITLLLGLKVMYPDKLWLLRGNHECSSINRIYGFYDECKRRYSIKLWKTLGDCFNCMPVAALVEQRILCMHGGLSPSLLSMDQIRALPRPQEVPDQGLMCDLLWADPEPAIVGWDISERGVSYVFGNDVIKTFLEKHDLHLICRAHQVVEDGYEFVANRRLVTVFSAPNYCGEFRNAGGMMVVDDKLCCSFKILRPADATAPRRYYK